MSREKAVWSWLNDYQNAWQNQNADLVATLFTEDAHYSVNPFQNALIGREAIREYWRLGAAASQEDIVFNYEVWETTERMTLVHWTASFTRTTKQEHVKMDGVFKLVFECLEDPRLKCASLEEWWFLDAEGR